MSKKITQRLAIVTGAILVIILLGSLYSVLFRDTSPIQERVFPNLIKNVNNITRISIKTVSNSLTFTKGEKNWILQEKHNYPVSIETLQTLILGMADLRYLEEKTSKPERYADIGVENIDIPDARSQLIQLVHQDGTIIVEILVGRQTPAKGLAANTASFIRKPSEATSWMADGLRPVSDSPLNWLGRQILNIPASDIKTVQLMLIQSTKNTKGKKSRKSKSSKTLILTRLSQEDRDFKIEGLSSKTKIKDQVSVNAIANSLLNFEFLDVAPASALGDKAWASTATFHDFNGRVITLHLVDASDVEITTSQEDIHDHEEKAPTPKGYWVKVAIQKNDEPVREEKFDNWIYLLPQETGDKLTTTLDQLVD